MVPQLSLNIGSVKHMDRSNHFAGPVANDHVVVCGVSGAGKSTVASALAERLGRGFIDADDFHSLAAKQKMASGVALSEQDRLPWLAVLHEHLAASPVPLVLACSALKRRYREQLSGGLRMSFIMLTLPPQTAAERVKGRAGGHFMPDSLVVSQFAALDGFEDCLAVEADQPLESVLQRCLVELRADALT